MAMQIGLIGAGNMASALARGWGEPVLVHDAFTPRAEALVAELGGEVVAVGERLQGIRVDEHGCALVACPAWWRRRDAAPAVGVVSRRAVQHAK